MWQGTIGRSMRRFSNEKGMTSESPCCSSSLEKSIVRLRMRGGVPVLSLPVVKPNRSREAVSPFAADSPSRPQGASYSPIKIRPPKKVPVVKTAARTEIMRPRSVTSAVIFCRGVFLSASALESGGKGLSDGVVIMSVTVSMRVKRFGVDSTVRRAKREYAILSACERGACTAGPRLLFSILN